MKDQICLITGGIGSIGTAICKEFINLGATVIAVDCVDEEKAKQWQADQKKQGYDVNYLQVDVTDYDSCAQMAERVKEQFGTVEVLVNAAGIIDDSTLRKMTPEQWRKVINTDLDSIFNMTKQFIEGMIDKKYGRIINFSSVNALQGQLGQTNYASAKSGIYGFTKSLALELAKYGVTVNSISPGYVQSKMVMSISEPIREKIIAGIPAGRFAQTDEIAWAITFLASERSGYITGTNLSINGGLHMY